MNTLPVAFNKAGVGNVSTVQDTAHLRKQAYLFVYGTLKRGGPLHPNLEKEIFVKEDTTYPNFTMLDLGAFPGLLPQGNTSIHGEIYLVDKEFLEILDFVEGVDEKIYIRTRIPTKSYQEVYLYLLSPQTVALNKRLSKRWEIIESGKWANA